MTFRKLIPVAAAVALAAGFFQSAKADVLFSTRGSGINQADIDNFVIFDSIPPVPGAVLEDATITAPGQHNISSLRLGYYNDSSIPVNVDALVTFYDDVAYSGTSGQPLATNQIGSTYRLSFTAIAGNPGDGSVIYGETGLLSLPSALTLPDNSFGIMVKFVNPSTTTLSNAVSAIWHNTPVTVGSSSDFFGADFDGNGAILFNSNQAQNEVATWANGGFDPANLYVEINGNLVPEPASLSVLALGGLAMVRRRRA